MQPRSDTGISGQGNDGTTVGTWEGSGVCRPMRPQSSLVLVPVGEGTPHPTPPAPTGPGNKGEPALVVQGQKGGTRGGQPTPGTPPGQPHACAPRSPRQALTHAGDLGEEQEKIISGVERQIQGKGLEELNRARASKGECRAAAGGPAGAERGAGQHGAPPPLQP